MNQTELLKELYPQTDFTRAVAQGYVSDVAIAAGLAVRTGSRHLTLDMSIGYMKEVAPPPPPPEPLVCTVDGVAVAELTITIKPVALLVTIDTGVHEVNRCWFQRGAFRLGVDIGRIGGLEVTGAEFNTHGGAAGLRLHFTHNYEMFIPADHCQSTWRRKTPD